MINFNDIRQIICKGEGIPIELIGDITRKKEVSLARQFIFKFMREYTKESLTSIGTYCNRDHATVLQGIQTLNNRIDTEKIISNKYINYNYEILEFYKFKGAIVDSKFDTICKVLTDSIKYKKVLEYDTVIVYNALIEKL